MTASRATANNLGDENALRVVANGGVTARNAEGTVRAANVTWGGGRITASGGVRAQRADLNLAANRFESDQAGRKAVLTGNVMVRHSNGATLRAPRARYDKAARKVWAEGGIQFNEPGGGVSRGKTLVANLNLKQAKITGFEGSINVKTFQGKDLF
jgi:lipopolysaccharide assembly outer membrane protein LptD (OstA)